MPLSPRGGPSMGRPPRAALDLRAERERNQRQMDLAINVVLGVLLLASGHWLGPLAWLGVLPLAGAALIFWTASRLQTSVQS